MDHGPTNTFPAKTLALRLLEAQGLDHIPRMGFLQHRIPDAESVSEHLFHTIFLVWSLSEYEPGIDRLKAMEIALLHDIGELKIGDLPVDASRLLGRDVKHRAELTAAEELFGETGARGRELVAEFLAGHSGEARFVSACDKLQLLVKCLHYERTGASDLGEFWENLAPKLSASEFEAVRRIYHQLEAMRAQGVAHSSAVAR